MASSCCSGGVTCPGHFQDASKIRVFGTLSLGSVLPKMLKGLALESHPTRKFGSADHLSRVWSGAPTWSSPRSRILFLACFSCPCAAEYENRHRPPLSAGKLRIRGCERRSVVRQLLI